MDGVIFYLTLLANIIFSNFYKKFDNVETRQNYGAGFGFLTACLICRSYIINYIILVCGNIVLLKCCDKSYVHQTTLVYSWLILLHMHFNASCSKYVIWLFQAITLKLVGMGFDRAMGDKKSEPTPGSSMNIIEEDDDENVSIVPSPFQLLIFAFYFIGIHRGPYYRWKTYQDHFNIPFNALGDCRRVTEFKLKKATAFTIAYCVLNILYPISMYDSNYFYNNFGTDYRFISNVPHMVKYFLEEQITMMLCTSVFTEAGFGLYPAKCQPLPGVGATTQLNLLRTIAEMPDEALKQEYNFSMLSCFNNERILMGPKMKDSMRGWNMPTRQWFWSNTYKNFIRSNKEVRSAWAFVLWTIWLGPSIRNIIKAVTLWGYIHLEDEFELLYNTAGPMKVTWDIGYSSMRIFCLIYLVPCAILEDSDTVMRYYGSLYWAYHFVLASLMVGAIAAHKSQPPQLPQAQPRSKKINPPGKTDAMTDG